MFAATFLSLALVPVAIGVSEGGWFRFSAGALLSSVSFGACTVLCVMMGI